MKKMHLISLIFLFSGHAANAQSIEDTVIYMLTGLEENESIIKITEGVDIFITGNRNVADNSLIMNGKTHDNKVTKMYFKFNNIDKCIIDGEINIDNEIMNISGNFNYTLDMAKTRGIKIRNGYTRIDGSSYSCSNIDGKLCNLVSNVGFLPFLNFGDMERVNKAYLHYKGNYCAGSAF